MASTFSNKQIVIPYFHFLSRSQNLNNFIFIYTAGTYYPRNDPGLVIPIDYIDT